MVLPATILCKYPCCGRKVFQDAHRIYDYCGKTHAQEHRRWMARVQEQHRQAKRPPPPQRRREHVNRRHQAADNGHVEGSQQNNDDQHEETNEQQNDLKKDDDFERALQWSISESLKYEKRKREVAADEALARKLQLQEDTEEEAGRHYICNDVNNRAIHKGHDNSNSPSSDWSCPMCTFLNVGTNRVCAMCDEKIPCKNIHDNHSTASTLLHVVVAPQPQSPRAATTAAAEDAVLIHEENKKENEDLFHLQQLEELEEYFNAQEESLRVASKTWACLTCHMTNKNNVDLCSQCLEPKAVSTRVRQQEQQLWPCSKCTFDNSFADDTCFMCGNGIPSSLRYMLNHARPSECGMPGCCKSATHYGFCSELHLNSALKKNILAPCEPGVEAVLVGHTGDYTAHLLRSSHPKHASVKKQFLDSWKKTTQGYPRVQRIYWIRMRPEILETFDLMKLQLGNCNVQRLFHGTSQLPACYFGTNPLNPPCNNKSCRVCSIIHNSFDLVHVKRGEGGKAWAHQTQQLRYGEGMYFSPVSSKSNDYNNLSERMQRGKRGVERKWKCMFLCNVVLGRQFKTTEGFLPQDKCPPAGYDSVWGMTGAHLNYDEACVYNANQAIPSYLIVYSLPK